MTVKLYDNNAYRSEFSANVVLCEKAEHGFRVILDKTAFFPTEGGQYFDSGTISGAAVKDVLLEGDDIVHITDTELSGEVIGRIDFAERFDKMQQHTGEHIVCGIVHEKYGYNNVGFHLGADDVTFDFDGPLSQAQLYEIERLANEAVFKNAPVTCFYPQDPADIDYRSKSGIEGSIRIVDIEGIDRCACCAPHVSSTGQVGLIHFTDSYPYKSGVRIHLACGARAVKALQSYTKNLRDISKSLSSGLDNAAEFFERYRDAHQETLAQLSAAKKELIAQKAHSMQAVSGSLIVFESALEASMLRGYANALSGKYTDFVFVFCGEGESHSFVAASDTRDMRQVANSLRQQLCAKCGGSDKMIQGSIPASESSIRKFLENI